MALLRPLLLDNVPSIQQSAALALGRLANYSDELAEAVVSNEILPQLVYSLSEQNVSILIRYILSVTATFFEHIIIFSYRDSTKKLLPTFSDQLPSTLLISLRLLSTLEPSMLSSTVSRSSIPLSRRLLPLPSLASPSTTTSLLRLLSMLKLLDFLFSVFKSPSLLSRESQLLLSEKLPNTPRNSPKLLSTKEPSLILLL